MQRYAAKTIPILVQVGWYPVSPNQHCNMHQKGVKTSLQAESMSWKGWTLRIEKEETIKEGQLGRRSVAKGIVLYSGEFRGIPMV